MSAPYTVSREDADNLWHTVLFGKCGILRDTTSIIDYRTCMQSTAIAASHDKLKVDVGKRGLETALIRPMASWPLKGI